MSKKHLMPLSSLEHGDDGEPSIRTGITGQDILDAALEIQAADRAAGRIGGIAGASVGTELLLDQLEQHSPGGAMLADEIVDALSQGHRDIELVMPRDCFPKPDEDIED